MSPLQPILFVAGLGVLVAGAYALIEGGVKVARQLGIPSVVIGLTVVAFGTSAPEFFVSLAGALRGSTGLVLGNVMGSNVANLGLILALAGLLGPVSVEQGLRRREIPLMTVATILFLVLVRDGVLSRVDAGLLTGGLVLFLGWLLLDRSRAGDPPVGIPDAPQASAGGRALVVGGVLTLGGILGLALGGRMITAAAVAMAHAMGVSETIIGLTVVAVGTSLPELATTVMAAVRREGDLAIGNIFGSNIFNLLGVAGPVGLLHPLAVESGSAGGSWSGLSLTGFDLQCLGLLVLTLIGAVLATAAPGGRLGRPSGTILLVLYFIIVAILFI